MRLWVALKEIARQVSIRPRFETRQVDYGEYWQVKRADNLGAANEYQLARARWIAERIGTGESVLDLGCGDGAQLMALRGMKQVRAVAADIAEQPLAYLASQGVSTLRCDLSDHAQIDGLPRQDHVLLLEVLEHFADSEALLARALARADSCVFFSVPNTGYIAYRLRLLFGRFPVQWRAHPGEHLRFWTLADLRWWLGQLKLSGQAEVGAYLGLPGLNRLFPGLFAAGLIVCIRKAPAARGSP